MDISNLSSHLFPVEYSRYQIYLPAKGQCFLCYRASLDGWQKVTGCPVVQACIPLLVEYMFIMQRLCPHFPCVCHSLVYMINQNVSMVITEITPCQRMMHIHWDIFKLNNYILGLGTCCLVDTGTLDKPAASIISVYYGDSYEMSVNIYQTP